MSDTSQVDDDLAGLAPAVKSAIDRLRTIVRRANSDLVEEIKWNAPSFSHRGEDRVTLGVGRKGEVRLVLHRGAKVQDASRFRFDDPNGLAKWPSPDRGVLIFLDEDEIQSRADLLTDLIARWIRAT